MTMTRFTPMTRLAFCLCAVLAAAVLNAATVANTWLGKTPKWTENANWSTGTAPAAKNAEDVLIVPGVAPPTLDADAVVGGALRLAAGARLDLNGHNLQVGSAAVQGTAPGGGLQIDTGATLASEQGASTLTLCAGGLVNLGQVRGNISLRIAGIFAGFAINGGKQLELAALTLDYSPFPYPVAVEGNVTVTGNLELAGGKLVIKPAPSRFEVKGDLLFRGKTPCVMVVPEGNLLLHGTIKSEGSAYCVEMPGEKPTWNKEDEAAYCETNENAGWVRMVGEGDQTIIPGGLLPAIRLEKPTGKVTVAGDLQCNGLSVARGNTLDLSKGQQLILGHFLRDWAKNPELNGVPAYGPCRTSRDLLNEGTIIGAPAVPVSFRLNVAGVRYVVQCQYWMPAQTADAKEEDEFDPNALLHQTLTRTAPGTLGINRYESRLQLKDGKLLLDGKPCDAATVKPVTDITLAYLKSLDTMDFNEKGGAFVVSAKAVVLNSAVKTVSEAFQAPAATSVNIAPSVERIATPSRGSFVLGWSCGGQGLYNIVDGDPGVGAGGAAYYDFIFPQPVTVGAVRLHSDTSLVDGCQFTVSADTGSGAWDTLLAWARDGVGSGLGWGESWTSFSPRKVSRLRLQVWAADGDACRPAVNEFEIFADAESANRLARLPEKMFPAKAAFLSGGDPATVTWPETPREDRVSRVASMAFWMAGISWSTAADESAYAKMPHLRDYAPCKQFLADVKDKYRYDAVTIFFEGEATGVPWPTINFKSALNASYLSKRDYALINRDLQKNQEDDFLDPMKEGPMDTLEASPEKFPDVLKVEDLPCQRNLLKEFCEAAHEKGLSVYIICRPEDMGKIYTGPKEQDPYEMFLKESAAGGVDGVSLTPDEDYPICWGSPRWQQYNAQTTAEQRNNFTPAETRRWNEERNTVAGLCMKDRVEAIRKVKPDCEFYVDGAHVGSTDPFDAIWHVADPDYVGCSYQSYLVPLWAATSNKRRVAMGEYPHRTVRMNLESLLLGAKMIRTYRYNYIEMAKSEEQRIRENQFIGQFMRWGGTRPARPPTALLVSRASVTQWSEDCAAGRVKAGDPGRGWMLEGILYDFLIKNGYTFDVYYLDQVADLQALKDYKLVILPFAYSVPRAAFDRMREAYAAGTNFLVTERSGDVDEIGQPYEKPLLAEWIAQGKQAGRITVPAVDLVAQENLRSFEPAMAAIVDPLLGARKDLTLQRYGNRIEGVVRAVSPGEQYASFINWEDKAVKIEAGLNLPAGQYKILLLSSATPEVTREGIIAGQRTFSAETLRSFALQLQADEVVSLYVAPADRAWGKW